MDERLKNIKKARYFFHDLEDSQLRNEWEWLIQQTENAQWFEKELERENGISFSLEGQLHEEVDRTKG